MHREEGRPSPTTTTPPANTSCRGIMARLLHPHSNQAGSWHLSLQKRSSTCPALQPGYGRTGMHTPPDRPTTRRRSLHKPNQTARNHYIIHEELMREDKRFNRLQLYFIYSLFLLEVQYLQLYHNLIVTRWI